MVYSQLALCIKCMSYLVLLLVVCNIQHTVGTGALSRQYMHVVVWVSRQQIVQIYCMLWFGFHGSRQYMHVVVWVSRQQIVHACCGLGFTVECIHIINRNIIIVPRGCGILYSCIIPNVYTLLINISHNKIYHDISESRSTPFNIQNYIFLRKFYKALSVFAVSVIKGKSSFMKFHCSTS